jgi:transposase
MEWMGLVYDYEGNILDIIELLDTSDRTQVLNNDGSRPEGLRSRTGGEIVPFGQAAKTTLDRIADTDALRNKRMEVLYGDVVDFPEVQRRKQNQEKIDAIPEIYDYSRYLEGQGVPRKRAREIMDILEDAAVRNFDSEDNLEDFLADVRKRILSMIDRGLFERGENEIRSEDAEDWWYSQDAIERLTSKVLTSVIARDVEDSEKMDELVEMTSKWELDLFREVVDIERNKEGGIRSRTEKNKYRDNKVIDVYLNSEMTIQEIAEQEGLSLDTVTGILRQARKRGEISGKRIRAQRGDDRETLSRDNRIVNAYLNTELPMSQIAKQEGLSLDVVTGILRRARIRGEISDKRKGGPKKRQTVSSGSRDPRSVQEFDKSFEEKYGEEPQYGSGDCFFSAISKAQELADVYDNVRVIHGVPLGTGGEAEGIRYPHAWVEFTQNIGGIDIEFIADFSNGNEVVVPKELYYKIGNIDPEFNRAYSIDEIEEKIEENGHAGPW